MNTKEEIFTIIKKQLVEHFEIKESLVHPEANVYEELDLDSIDAIDLVIKLQDLTGKKVKPDEFKSVRTVNDIVEVVHNLVHA